MQLRLKTDNNEFLSKYMWEKHDPGIISQLTAFTIIGHKII